jgi:hypothetical protein
VILSEIIRYPEYPDSFRRFQLSGSFNLKVHIKLHGSRQILMADRLSEKHFVRISVVWAIVHFVLSIICLSVSFGASMEQFDNPEYSPSPIMDPLEFLAEILMQPGSSVWTSWMSRNMPDIVEWLIFMGNSVLWGFGIAAVAGAWPTIRRWKRRLMGRTARP